MEMNPHQRDAQLRRELDMLSTADWRMVHRLVGIVSETVETEWSIKADRCILALTRRLPGIAASIERTAARMVRYDRMAALMSDMMTDDDIYQDVADDPEWQQLTASLEASLPEHLYSVVREYVLNREDMAFAVAADRLDRCVLAIVDDHPRDDIKIIATASMYVGFSVRDLRAYFASMETTVA
jgi:hypothetical protein